MISSPLAVLKSPASGVSGAVTGYPIGRGNGVSTIFAAPPEITAITTLYRRDWQGNVALSASPRTNYFLQSQNFNNNSSWILYSSAITSNAISAPDNTITGQKLVETNVVDAHYVIQSPTSIPSGTLAISVYVKAGERNRFYIETNATGAYRRNFFDLLAKTATPAALHTASITDIGNGWLRCTIICTTTGGAVNVVFGLVQNTSGGSNTYNYLGDGSSGVYIWGSQIEIANAATPYIPTTNVSVTVTDYTASGTTLTLAEAPARAAELVVDGTGVNLPLLQIGG